MANPVDASQTYEQLWFAGSTPDLLEFTALRAGLSAAELAALVRIDQRECSRLGRLMRAEDYLAALPRLAADAELALDVVYHEYLLREQSGERPTAAEYADRFQAYVEGVCRESQMDIVFRHPAYGSEAAMILQRIH